MKSAVLILPVLLAALAGCSSPPPQAAADAKAKQVPLSVQLQPTTPPPPPSEIPAPAFAPAMPSVAKRPVERIEVTGSSISRSTGYVAAPKPALLREAIAAPPADMALPVPENRERYKAFERNGVMRVAEAPVSTFSIDVDTGSYSNMRRMLNAGQLPPRDAVRVEELVNYFPYQYALPKDDKPFAVSTEIAPTPWNPDTLLLRIGLQASDPAKHSLPPSNLVFLVDVSGSMDEPDKLPLLKQSLKLFVAQLRPQDRVAMVTYASGTQVVLEPTAGDRKAQIIAAIDRLQPGGSTAGEAGIQLAYQMAKQGMVKGGINRILLATDGDFNVGITDFNALKNLVEEKRKAGVSLTTLGLGTGNYNDQLMKQLADAGDGAYHYLDTLGEAQKVLVDEFTSTLQTVASDVKIQLEFNPAVVAEYRQIGFEQRALKREDFANDAVDAGEIGAGHRVTALYEISLVGGKGRLAPLRYGDKAAVPSTAASHGELGFLQLRYKAAQGEASKLLSFPISREQIAKQGSCDFRFAAAVAAFGQRLSDGGKYLGGFDLTKIRALAMEARGEDRFGHRGEFIKLVDLARSMSGAPELDKTALIAP
ncbi:von Willebrand factor type A domain-containing protein [Chitinimonas sp.]|uniref:vWA domain-containing protein n=1 Tax=Chitinimonas sp. TaxID=1934313 RepID=UPI0035B45565